MKSPFKSWTLWFNVLLVLAGLYLPGLCNDTGAVLIATGLAGIGLRLKTKDALKVKK